MFSDKAKWLACMPDIQTPIVYKMVILDGVDNAEIDICGLGYYELFINGIRVGNEFFKPVFSDYSERDFSNYLYPLPDKTSHTIYYNRIDVTKYLTEGQNTVVVMLGNGFYRQTKREIEGRTKFGDSLLLCYNLKVYNKNITTEFFTDGSELVSKGYITENNLFYGEIQDFSLWNKDIFSIPDYKECCKAIVIDAPKAKFYLQSCPNDKVIRKITPRELFKTENGAIYDVGENVTGFVSFIARGGDVKIFHAENVSDFKLDYFSAGSVDQISAMQYLNTIKGQTLHPYFCWSGFRYFEFIGEAENITVEVVHSNIEVNSSFECGNDVLNWIYNAYLRTQLGNMHGGIPSDCPHRERLGYTGDGQLICESAMLLTDSRLFFEKWLNDIADCQDVNTGHVQHTAPLCGGGGGPGGWGGAIALVPYYHYKLYADKSIIKKYLPNIHKYLDCMASFTENGLVVKERDKGWCLGDWCTPESVVIPEPFVNTYYYVKCMQIADYFSQEIGDNIRYRALIEQTKLAIQKKYYNENDNTYCGGVQGANAFALSIGLGNKQMEELLVKKYSELGCFDTGIFGTDVLCAYLADNGYTQLLFNLLTSIKYPSFGYMMLNGATTLWEDWDGRSSHNHPMFGACVKQIFYGILGVKVMNGGGKIIINPQYIPKMKYCNFSLTLGEKKIEINYLFNDQGIYVKINVDGEGVFLLNEEKELPVCKHIECFIKN